MIISLVTGAVIASFSLAAYGFSLGGLVGATAGAAATHTVLNNEASPEERTGERQTDLVPLCW